MFRVPCVRACAKSLSGVLWVCTQYSTTMTTHVPFHTLLCQSFFSPLFFPLCPLVLGVELGKHCTTELCLQPAWPISIKKQIKTKNKYHCPSVANPWVSVFKSVGWFFWVKFSSRELAGEAEGSSDGFCFVCLCDRKRIKAPRVGSSIPGSRSLLYGGPYLTVRLGGGEVRS